MRSPESILSFNKKCHRLVYFVCLELDCRLFFANKIQSLRPTTWLVLPWIPLAHTSSTSAPATSNISTQVNWKYANTVMQLLYLSQRACPNVWTKDKIHCVKPRCRCYRSAWVSHKQVPKLNYDIIYLNCQSPNLWGNAFLSLMHTKGWGI
jgi:hypothetical protein